MDMLDLRIRGAKTNRGSEPQSEMGMGISMRKTWYKPSTAKESTTRLKTGPKTNKQNNSHRHGLKQACDHDTGAE